MVTWFAVVSHSGLQKKHPGVVQFWYLSILGEPQEVENNIYDVKRNQRFRKNSILGTEKWRQHKYVFFLDQDPGQ